MGKCIRDGDPCLVQFCAYGVGRTSKGQSRNFGSKDLHHLCWGLGYHDFGCSIVVPAIAACATSLVDMVLNMDFIIVNYA